MTFSSSEHAYTSFQISIETMIRGIKPGNNAAKRVWISDWIVINGIFGIFRQKSFFFPLNPPCEGETSNQDLHGPNQTTSYRETSDRKTTYFKITNPFWELLHYQVADAMNRINSFLREWFGTSWKGSIGNLIKWMEHVCGENEKTWYSRFFKKQCHFCRIFGASVFWRKEQKQKFSKDIPLNK